MQRRLFVSMALLLLVQGAIFSCAPFKKQTREELLYQQSAEYHKNMRWKRLQGAVVFVSAEKRADFLNEFRDRIDDLDIDDWEIEHLEFEGEAPKYTAATISIIRYQVEAPSVTRRKVAVEQRWEYQEPNWVLVEGY